MARIGINGFGRIGRMVFRACMHFPELEFVAVNDLTDTKTLAYMLKHDSVHGKLDIDISHDEDHLYVGGKTIKVYAQRDPANIPWSDHDVDIVVESTGFFRTRETAEKHLQAGAKKVLISAPAKSDDIKTIIMGVNEHEYNGETIVSNASCTSNSLAPLVKVLHDNFGIENGVFSTVHSVTGDQRNVDAPHKDVRRGRSCMVNIVPTSSGAAIAVTEAIPELEGHMTGMAYRVPTVDGSITEFCCTLKNPTDIDHINALFKSVAENHMPGILEYSEEPLVSTDIIGNPHSAIFDSHLTEVEGNLIRVVAWYDNEWGYSNRMADVLRLMSS